ncbi:MAG: glycosyltransferase family 2 protein [Bacteroidales bacterium]|nr:glycosyltransferase family 2 protein [Bacteroidales bacterium]
MISIIIINFNTPDLTTNCINSLVEHTKNIDYEIIVIDNGSTLKFDISTIKNSKKIKYIYSEQNLGFTGGNNLGLKYATGEYILLLNSDTIIKENVVKLCFEEYQKYPKCGALTPKLISPNGEIQPTANRRPSLRLELRDLFRINKITSKQKLANLYLGTRHNYNISTTCDWIYGTFFLIKKDIIDKIFNGEFPNHFFMYGEDMLWCLLLKKKGYKIIYTPISSIIHLGGASMKPIDEEDKYFKYMLPNVFKTISIIKTKFHATLIILTRILILLSHFKQDSNNKAKRYWNFLKQEL